MNKRFRSDQHLRDVAESRVPVAQVPNLISTQAIETVIPLPKVALPVLPLAVGNASESENKDSNLSNQIDSVASWVFWLL
jgi:hypothetical protein